MGSRLVVRGKVLAQSADVRSEELARRRALEVREAFIRARMAEAGESPEAAEQRVQALGEPPAKVVAQRADPVFYDAERGITFRVIHHIRVSEGWATEQTIAGYFAIQVATVHHLARHKFLDAAMEPLSPVRRYRVLDVHKVRVEIERLRAERKKAAQADPVQQKIRAQRAAAQAARAEKALVPHGSSILAAMAAERKA